MPRSILFSVLELVFVFPTRRWRIQSQPKVFISHISCLLTTQKRRTKPSEQFNTMTNREAIRMTTNRTQTNIYTTSFCNRSGPNDFICGDQPNFQITNKNPVLLIKIRLWLLHFRSLTILRFYINLIINNSWTFLMENRRKP